MLAWHFCGCLSVSICFVSESFLVMILMHWQEWCVPRRSAEKSAGFEDSCKSRMWSCDINYVALATGTIVFPLTMLKENLLVLSRSSFPITTNAWPSSSCSWFIIIIIINVNFPIFSQWYDASWCRLMHFDGHFPEHFEHPGAIGPWRSEMGWRPPVLSMMWHDFFFPLFSFPALDTGASSSVF